MLKEVLFWVLVLCVISWCSMCLSLLFMLVISLLGVNSLLSMDGSFCFSRFGRLMIGVLF